MDWFRRSVGTFQNAWSGFPVSYRVLTGFLLVLLALVGVWGVNASGGDAWVRIDDGRQTMDQRAQILTALKEKGIKARVEGDAISVAKAQADEAMLQLHSSGTLGDEAFFKFLQETDLFGTRENSDRQWRVAVQGRLAAMIQGLDYVRRAWVQIAEPADAKSLWWANGKESTAAVILEPEPNQVVTAARARAIATLMSGALNLKANNVRILDKSGRCFRISEDSLSADADLQEQEIARASMIEEKVLRILPPDSRASVQVRLNAEKREGEKKTFKDDGEEKSRWESGVGATIDWMSIAVVIPEESPEVPRTEGDRQEFVRDLKLDVRAASGAMEQHPVSIRIAPTTTRLADAVPAPAPQPPSWIEAKGPTILLVTLGFVAIGAVFALVRGMGPPPSDGGVVAEESLRSPGESILAAQDEVLDGIRDRVRRSVSRNPREAADVARRWMS